MRIVHRSRLLVWIKSCYIERYSPLDLFEPASGVIRIPQHRVNREEDNKEIIDGNSPRRLTRQRWLRLFNTGQEYSCWWPKWYRRVQIPRPLGISWFAAACQPTNLYSRTHPVCRTSCPLIFVMRKILILLKYCLRHMFLKLAFY